MKKDKILFGRFATFQNICQVESQTKSKAMLQLSKSVVVKSKRNWKLYARLMLFFDVHQYTIENWIKLNDYRLAHPSAVEIFSEVLGIEPSEVLEQSQPVTA